MFSPLFFNAAHERKSKIPSIGALVVSSIQLFGCVCGFTFIIWVYVFPHICCLLSLFTCLYKELVQNDNPMNEGWIKTAKTKKKEFMYLIPIPSGADTPRKKSPWIRAWAQFELDSEDCALE
mmetsp:Transcript_85865/g.228915  ORF Transcript_85865/g.228915 Transcript_85865/m.228915 type:complete len:122 (-) Transcript_85865:1944-2309(-)